MKNVSALLVLLEAAPEAHMRWLAAQALASYGTFLMQKHWTSKDFAWGSRWDAVVPLAITMLEAKLPYIKRSMVWLGPVWASDMRKTATALLGRLTDCNTMHGSGTSQLVVEAGAIHLLIKVLREGTLEGAFTSRNAAYCLRNLIREPNHRELVFQAGAIGPLHQLLASSSPPDGKAIAARALQKLTDPVEGMDEELVLAMQQVVAHTIGLPAASYAVVSAELKRRAML